MKKLIALILVINLICLTSIGLAENITFNSIKNGNGKIFTTDYIMNYISEDKIEDNKYPSYSPLVVYDSVKTENHGEVSFNLYKLTVLDTNDIYYGIDCGYYNKKNSYSTIYKIIEYDEIDNVIKVLTMIKDFMENYKQYKTEGKISASYHIYYTSINGIRFEAKNVLGAPSFYMYFDEDNYFYLEETGQIDIMINYFNNIDNLIENNNSLPH